MQVNRPENAAGLEAQLAKHGITANVVYLPWSQECQTGRYTEVALGQTRGMAGEFGEDRDASSSRPAPCTRATPS